MNIRKQTKVWTTKDKRRLRICDMADDHLVNTINMLRRAAAVKCARNTLFYLTCPGPTATHASDLFEMEQNHAFEATWEDYVHELYDPMLLDFHRRGLDLTRLKSPPDGQLVAAGKLLKAFRGDAEDTEALYQSGGKLP